MLLRSGGFPMLLMGSLILGAAAPLVVRTPRELAICGLTGALLLAALWLQPWSALAAPGVGLLTLGFIGGAVGRGLMFLWAAVQEDRAIRKTLPRELPQRYR